jgi:hypothetical protein
MLMDDPEHIERLAAEGVGREAGRDILAYLEARRQADQARTEHIIEALTHGMDAETANTHNPEEGDQ